jgi:hypothetical protein
MVRAFRRWIVRDQPELGVFYGQSSWDAANHAWLKGVRPAPMDSDMEREREAPWQQQLTLPLDK